MAKNKNKKGFGTAPVFFTAISTILGAILFLRFGYAVGTVSFFGTLLIIILGHTVTLPTAFAISEIATNQRVEGGGEYFIISRSFGLNIGATIGIALYMSQAISVAFYVIAFTEAFEPLFTWISESFWPNVPRQIISVPTMIGLAFLMLSKGANIGVKALYVVVGLLALSLVMFFMGTTSYVPENGVSLFTIEKGVLSDNFFVVFAIIFPAFTGMTAGVGLSGDLRNPGKSIPIGTTAATIFGMIVYIFIAWKLANSVHPDDLATDYQIMKKVALHGGIIIPLGLAASTISSALGSIMVAPRTLQALGQDDSIPFKKLNKIVARGKGKNKEPVAATFITCIIAMVFVLMGEVDSVAKIISMFFMVTYGAICLISFLYHFGADPSYRPVFRSKWYLSLTGFVFCVWLMFRIDATMALLSIIFMFLLYIVVSYLHKDRGGMQSIFRDAVFQLSRNIRIFIQNNSEVKDGKWRPSVVCISRNSFERDKPMRLLGWIADKYGFGTYIHLIEDYFSKATSEKSKELKSKLIEMSGEDNNVYIDTLISPSFTSAIAQIIQLPGISGMQNNMLLFEIDKENPDGLLQIVENIPLARAANLDVCVLAASQQKVIYKKGIHVWIKSTDRENSNLMILLSYIMLGHNDWKKGKIKIFEICKPDEINEHRLKLLETIQSGRLPISPGNIEIIATKEDVNSRTQIIEHSKDAGLVVLGFREEHLKIQDKFFSGYNELGDVLFVNSSTQKEI